MLRGVPTFVVNGFHHSDKYDEVDPRFHCFCDERVIRENRDSIVPYMARRKDKTSYFFYQRGIGVVPEGENVYFVHSKIWPTSSKLRCDLSQTANAWINVIPFAVMCAIHLGFTQIDLLGCDFSLFASRKDAHFYDASNAAQRRESLYQDLQGHAIACRQHEYLRDYAAARGIQIRNATPGSLLDVYPRIDIDELVLRKEAP